MLHHDIFQSLSPETIRIENIVLSPNEKNPVAVNKPSNFSIDHILNSAGASVDKCSIDDGKNSNENHTQNGFVNDTHDCYLMDSNVQHYPPILNWLQYSRYKPPRLPRKRFSLNRNSSVHLAIMQFGSDFVCLFHIILQ